MNICMNNFEIFVLEEVLQLVNDDEKSHGDDATTILDLYNVVAHVADSFNEHLIIRKQTNK